MEREKREEEAGNNPQNALKVIIKFQNVSRSSKYQAIKSCQNCNELSFGLFGIIYIILIISNILKL